MGCHIEGHDVYEKSFIVSPVPSNRQHLCFDDCLEVSREIIRTVLCCIVYNSFAQ